MKPTNPLLWSMVALSACAGRTDSVGPSPAGVAPDSLADGHVTTEEYNADEARARESLDRLDALEVLDVGALLVDSPEGAHNCYGPCEDDPTAQRWMQEHALQVARLQALVAEAERVAEDAPTSSWEVVPDAVETLRGLEIVDVRGTYVDADGSCYVGSCPGDDARAGILAELAELTREL